MFYEVRPWLISLAKSESATWWICFYSGDWESPGFTTEPLFAFLWLHLWEICGWFCIYQCTQALPWVFVHDHSGTGTYQPLQPRGHFAPGTTCLEVPEKPDFTFSLAKSSRLGSKSHSHITSLMKKGTPNPSVFQAPVWMVRGERNKSLFRKDNRK